LIDGLEKFGCDVFWEEGLKKVEIVRGFGGWETTEEVEGCVEGHSWIERMGWVGCSTLMLVLALIAGQWLRTGLPR
jgi:hypothetical protein